MTHPIRNAVIHTFKRKDSDGKGREWIAQFFPYKIYPVFFSGKTEEDVIDSAEAVRAEAIQKHEADCIRRQDAKEKAAQKRKSKEPT
tara:strand:+ start:547 stop:807 length:261 start_codon:yes stop_codon:yes gene_type:complete